MQGQSSKKTMGRRLKQVMSLQQRIAFKNNKQMINKTHKVLIEELIPTTKAKREEERLHGLKGGLGRSYGDAPDVDANVIVQGTNIEVGDFQNVLITDTKDYDLIGHCTA